MVRALPGGRVGWQRQRAWILVFSSAHSTYSSGPSGRPWKRRAYRSSTRLALARKSGSRMKIHERCCQGLIASLASQRPTVDAEIAVAMPRVTASRASSGQLHTDSGTPCSAGKLAGQRLDLGDLQGREAG